MESEPGRRAGVVIPAAGLSARMGTDKMLVELDGAPILAHTIKVFQTSPRINQIVVVGSRTNVEPIRRLVEDFSFSKVSKIVHGGPRRQDSVWDGLSTLSGCDWAIIHDGARPFLSGQLIDAGLEAALATGSAVAAVPVKDTIKLADRMNIVQQTLPRELLWCVQTPQVFRYDIITDAYLHVMKDVTDDAQLVELRGWPVKIYDGSYDNIKITTIEDLELARLILERRKRGGR